MQDEHIKGWLAEAKKEESDYLEAGTRRAGVEELAMILPPWSIKRDRVGSR